MSGFHVLAAGLGLQFLGIFLLSRLRLSRHKKSRKSLFLLLAISFILVLAYACKTRDALLLVGQLSAIIVAAHIFMSIDKGLKD